MARLEKPASATPPTIEAEEVDLDDRVIDIVAVVEGAYSGTLEEPDPDTISAQLRELVELHQLSGSSEVIDILLRINLGYAKDIYEEEDEPERFQLIRAQHFVTDALTTIAHPNKNIASVLPETTN